MDLAAAISRLGFKRWYERQLIEGHGYLVTCFLCMIAAAATVESFFADSLLGERMAMAAVAFTAGAVGFLAWSRYRDIMARAEWLGDQATCPACSAYARFRILDARPRRAAQVGARGLTAARIADATESRLSPFAPVLPPPYLRVECKRCGHQWTI